MSQCQEEKKKASVMKITQVRTFVFGDSNPIAIEHGKKWAVYDKNDV